METLGEEEQSADRSANTSFPVEITDDILSRLPVKSLLRFRSVSKPWLSRIGDPSFTKLHFTRATVNHRTGLLISAFDKSTGRRHFLSAAHDDGPVSNLITVYDSFNTQIQHSNGLVFFTYGSWVSGNVYADFVVLNPSTRKIFKIPVPDYTNNFKYEHLGYLFGYDEFTNEHKIVLIRKVKSSTTIEIMIFSMSNYSWRKINVDGFCDRDRLKRLSDGGVCVNSVVHVMLQDMSCDLLAFDLKTEKLSIISISQGAVSHELTTRKMKLFMRYKAARIMEINGCVCVVVYDHVVESNEIDIWVLQDYENRVWVKETIKVPVSWMDEFRGSYSLSPKHVVNMEDEILFYLSKIEVSENEMIVPIYNVKSKCFKSLHFTHSHPFMCSKTMKFSNIKCYVESIIPL